MQLFFAVTGAQGSLAVVMGTAPTLLVFSLVQVRASTPKKNTPPQCAKMTRYTVSLLP